MGKTFIAGPCVIESAELLDQVAAKLVEINKKYGTDIIFKASFDKANRTSIGSFRGPGIDRGLQMLSDVKAKYGLRLLTDIHEACIKYGTEEDGYINYVKGANIAGFIKVANAMVDQGLV